MSCTVDGCERKHLARGYCGTHLARVRRTGEPGPASVRQYEPRGTCSVTSCDREVEGRGLCQMHYMRDRRTGDPEGLTPVGKGDAVEYDGAHSRVRALHGRPSAHACAHGCGAAAVDWAYDHADPTAKVDPKGRPYSTDPAHYVPLCRTCHKRFDVSVRAMA